MKGEKVLQYIITTVDPLKNSGGNKAKKDIDFFASQLPDTGVIHIPVHSTRLRRFLLTRLNVIRQIKSHPAQRYIIQYPVATPFMLKQIIHVIRKVSHAKIDLIIHDIPTLQFKKQSSNEELAILNGVDGLVVHNHSMEKVLRENNVKTKMVILGLFDYDNRQPMRTIIKYDETICFPGNLAKSLFLTKLSLQHRLDIYGPNKLAGYPKCVRYCGQYTPEELPKHLDENFGLIWDGDSTETCSGTFGNYLRYNNPHKASLYLSSGIPIIIWNQAALARLVKEHNVGITISSLAELDSKLSALSDSEYQVMKKNAQKMGILLRKGYYIQHAINELATC